MTDAPPVLNRDTLSRVESSLLCRACGYELRGLAIERNCPECGLAIAESMRGDALEFASVKWLNRVTIGSRLAALGLLLIALPDLLFYLIPTAFGATSLRVSMWYFHKAANLIFIVGGWFITTPETGGSSERTFSARRIGRIGFVIAAATIVIDIAFFAAFSRAIAPTYYWHKEAAFVLLYWGIAWPIFLRYLARISKRIPSKSIAVQLRVLLFVCITTATITSGSYLMLIASFPSPASGANWNPGAVFWIGMWGARISGGLLDVARAYAGVLLILIARRLRKIVRARQIISQEKSATIDPIDSPNETLL